MTANPHTCSDAYLSSVNKIPLVEIGPCRGHINKTEPRRNDLYSCVSQTSGIIYSHSVVATLGDC